MTPSFPAFFAWLGLALIYAGFCAAGFVFHCVPPILPVLINELDLSHGQAGLLMSMFALPGILLALPGGWLVDRWGDRVVGAVGLAVTGAGTLALAAAADFTLMLAARMIAGAGMAVGVVALQRGVVRLFAGRPLGLPMGVSGSALPLGIIIVLNVAGPVAAQAGWREVPLRAGAGALAAGLVFLAAGAAVDRRALRPACAAANSPAGEPPSGRTSQRALLLAGAVWFCANGAMTAFLTFAPDHYLDLGFSLHLRGLITSLPMWVSAGLGTAVGWLCDRHGGKPAVIAAGMLLMAAALVAAPGTATPPLAVGLALGLALAMVVTPLLSLVGEVVAPQRLGRGFGILAMFASVGIFLVPPAAGLARDATGSYLGPFLLMAAVAAGGAVCAETLRRGRLVRGLRLRAAAVMVLLLAGCGTQDRHQVAPQVLVAVEPAGGAVLRPLPPLMASRYVAAGDAWSATRGMIVGRDGGAMVWQDDGVRPVFLDIGDDDVQGVSCRPDGSAWAATRYGDFARWDGGAWHIEPTGADAAVAGLLVDDTGQPVIWTANSLRRRGDDGAWTELARRDGWIYGAWSDPVAGVVAVTNTAEVLRWSGGVLSSVQLDEPDVPLNWNLRLAGDGAGRVALRLVPEVLWLYDGGAWTRHATSSFYNDDGLFWHDGELFGVAHDKLRSWTGTDWSVETPLSSFATYRSAVAVDGRTLLFGSRGEVAVFDGTDATLLAPGQGGLEGVTHEPAGWRALDVNGVLWSLDDGEDFWRGEKVPHLENSGGRTLNRLLHDDLGRLVATDALHLVVRDGAAWTLRYETDDYRQSLEWVRRLDDGRIVILSDDGVRTFSADSFQELLTGADFDAPRAVHLLPSQEMLVIDDLSLLHFTPEGRRLQWVAVGWQPWDMWPCDGGVLVGGYSGARLLQGDAVTDLTPQRRGGHSLEAGSVMAAEPLPDGRLLAWDPYADALYLHDAQGWRELVFAAGNAPWSYGIDTIAMLVVTDAGVVLCDGATAVIVDLAGVE